MIVIENWKLTSITYNIENATWKMHTCFCCPYELELKYITNDHMHGFNFSRHDFKIKFDALLGLN
jgi:hypothetical protein